MANQILDLATIESGKISLSQEPVKLSDIMHECRAMMEPLAQQHDIKLIFLPFDNSWFVNADRTRLKQVVINLLSNAVKYNREHGSVEVKCDLNTPELIRISIKDSGEPGKSVLGKENTTRVKGVKTAFTDYSNDLCCNSVP